MASRGFNRQYVPAIAAAVALIGLIGLLVVEHRWQKRDAKAEMIQHDTTDASAAANGATVTPTEEKRELDPAVHAPKQVIPDQKKS
jgi:hypothetical protein